MRYRLLAVLVIPSLAWPFGNVENTDWTYTSANDLTAITPAVEVLNAQDGDGLVLHCSIHGDDFPWNAGPSGSGPWTFIRGRTSGEGPKVFLYALEATGSETDQAYTTDASADIACFVYKFPGPYDSGAIIDQAEIANGAGLDSSPSITPTVTPSTVFSVVADQWLSEYGNVPSGMTLVHEVEEVQDGSDRWYGAAFEDYTGTTATGSLTWHDILGQATHTTFNVIEIESGVLADECAAGTLSVTAGTTGNSAEFQPCRKREFPDLVDTVGEPILTLNPDYYVAGCRDGGWTATTLPAGISITENANGLDVLTGTPTTGGTVSASITCTTPVGSLATNFTWTINPADGGGEDSTDLTPTVDHVVDSTAGAGGNGSKATPWDQLSDVTLAANDLVCLMDGSSWNERWEDIDQSGVTIQTCYEDGSNLYAWDDGPSAGLTTMADINYTTGLDCTGPSVLSNSGAIDDLTIRNVRIGGDNHSCTSASNQANLISFTTAGMERLTLDGVVIEPWPNESAARAAYKRHRVNALLIRRVAGVTLTDVTIRYGFNGLLLSNGVSDIRIIDPDFTRVVHNGINFAGTDGTEDSFMAWISGGTIGYSYDSDGIQFESSHASGTGTPATLRDVVIEDVDIPGTVGENAIDLKGAGNILITGVRAWGHPSDDDGPCDGTLQVQSTACDDTTAYTHGDAPGNGAIMHGSGGTEVATEAIIILRPVLYDNGGAISLMNNDFWVSHPTLLANNRDYAGSNSTFTRTARPPFTNAVNFVSATAESGVHNGILCFSNTQNIGFAPYNEIYADYLLFCTDFSDDPDYATGNPSPYTVTETLAEFQTYMQGDASLTGDCANCIEAAAGLVNLPNADPSGDYTSQGYDFTPDTGSAAIGAGGPTMLTASAGSGSGTVVVDVDDAKRLWPRFTSPSGAWERPGQYILFGTCHGEVTDRDYDSATNTIDVALSGACSWSDNDEIWLSDDTQLQYDDLGACEVGVSNRC